MPRQKPAANPAASAAETKTLTGYKAFREDLTCCPDSKPFQFEIGQTYRHDGEVEACRSGFHAVTGHPLAIFKYYPPAGTRFCQVEISGAMETDDGGEKTAAEILTVGKEIGLTQLILDAVKWVQDRAKPVEGDFTSEEATSVKSSKHGGAATASGRRGAATASGIAGAATASGDCGAATASGERGAATASGERGAATASGYQGAATASGYQGAATASGWRGAATASGYQGAATASGRRGAATASGYQGAATASGTCGAATASGTCGAATARGKGGIAMAVGPNGKARGAMGCDLVLREFDTAGNVVSRWIGVVDGVAIKPETYYRLVDGKPVAVE